MYDLVRRRLNEIIPLNKLLGIEIVSIGDGVAEARLPFRDDLTNHMGTMHATAIFGLAEAASGCAMSGAFVPIILRIRAVAVTATAKFSKIARGDLIARARVLGESGALQETLAAAGRVQFDVQVSVLDPAGAEIGELTVAWQVSSKPAK
jgi:uncharacterized protein (TIGR00369 family)